MTTPRIVCLCGSTKFGDYFRKAMLDKTLAGEIYLSVGCLTHSDAELEQKVTPEIKAKLDELHFRKIDLADYIYVINPGGYIGESTRNEIQYAVDHGKQIEFQEECHFSSTIYMVHTNWANSTFVKELEFFKSQGGLTKEWGRCWKPVFAASIEEARKIGAEKYPSEALVQVLTQPLTHQFIEEPEPFENPKRKKEEFCPGCEHSFGDHYKDVQGTRRCLHVDSGTSSSGIIEMAYSHRCDCKAGLSQKTDYRRKKKQVEDAERNEALTKISEAIKKKVCL